MFIALNGNYVNGNDMQFNRAAFLAGSLATLGAALPLAARSNEPAAPSVAPDDALARLIAGNKRFVNGEVPALSDVVHRREMLEDGQAPFAAILSCADSRVIPEYVFVQGLGELFVVRVAGNFPDDMVIGSLEYALDHLGTRLVMVLGHENCGAVKAVYDALQSGHPVPPHLRTIENAMAPGIVSVVHSHGSMKDAVTANVRVAVAKLAAAPPTFSEATRSGRVRVVGAYYALENGQVTLVT